MSTVTQSDIARRLGVSQQTVGFALNNYRNSRMTLRPEKRQLILETAQKMGYVPHHAARRLARSRADHKSTSFDQVGLIHLIPADTRFTFVDPVCLAMMQGAEYELSKLHASLTFVRVGQASDWDKVERLTRAGGIDGWLVYGPPNDVDADRLRSTKLPFVILGDRRCTQPVHAVNIDNLAVARLAVKHLASLGHRRIAYMAGSMDFVFQEQILRGFRAAVKDLGLDDDERLFVNFSTWENPGVQPPINWLQNLDPMPTAVFMPDIGVAQSLQPIFRLSQSAALREISVLSCGATPPDGMGQEFKRIDLPMIEVGRQGAVLLHQIVAGSRIECTEVKIPPSLIGGGNESGSDKRTNN